MTDTTSTDRVRTHLLAGAMVLCPLLLLTGTLLEVDTGDGSAQELAAVAAERSRFYASTLVLSLGLALLGPTAIGLMRLARGRGGALATVGGCLLLVGGTAASAGIFMYGAVTSVAAGPDLDREAMVAFIETAGDSPYASPPFFIGFFGLALGLVVLGLALLRARTVPVWQPALLIVGAVTTFFAEGSTAVVLLGTTPLLVLVALAVEVARPQRTPVSPDVPGQRSAGVAAPVSSSTTG